MKRFNLIIVAVVLAFVIIAGIVSLSSKNSDSTKSNGSTPIQRDTAVDSKGANPVATSGASATNATSTEALLLYLIEEEKLAHDVYTVMYEKYGSNVFGNILQSESTHQSKVLSLLQARSIADPRSTQVGVFQNQELQNLYDVLVKQGNMSAVEAYNVGVIIEEKDIKDITAQLATATDQDVISILNVLRDGSENHLRAFNRKL